MPKGQKKEDGAEKARRRLSAALLELRAAQEKRDAAILQGEREIREAQELALRRSRKATERVERKAAAVARAESDLQGLTERPGDRV